MNEEIVDLFHRPAYIEILVCLIIRKKYATAVTRTLKKKQPTVTEQLKLEKILNLNYSYTIYKAA